MGFHAKAQSKKEKLIEAMREFAATSIGGFHAKSEAADEIKYSNTREKNNSCQLVFFHPLHPA